LVSILNFELCYVSFLATDINGQQQNKIWFIGYDVSLIAKAVNIIGIARIIIAKHEQTKSKNRFIFSLLETAEF